MGDARERRKLLNGVELREADWSSLMTSVATVRAEAENNPRRTAAAHAEYLSALLKALDRAVPSRRNGEGRLELRDVRSVLEVWHEATVAMRAIAPGLKVDSIVQIEAYAYNLLGRASEYGAHDMVIRASAAILRALCTNSKTLPCQLLFGAEHPLLHRGKENQSAKNLSKDLASGTLESVKALGLGKRMSRPLKEVDLVINTIHCRCLSLLDLASESDLPAIASVRLLVETVLNPIVVDYPPSPTKVRHAGVVRKLLLRAASKLMNPTAPSQDALLEAVRCRCLTLRWVADVTSTDSACFDAHTFADMAHKTVISAERRTSHASESNNFFCSALIKVHSDNFKLFVSNAATEDWALESVAAWFDHQISLLARQSEWTAIEDLTALFLGKLGKLGRHDLSFAVELTILVLACVHGDEAKLQDLSALLNEERHFTLQTDGSSHLRFIRVLEPVRRIACNSRPVDSVRRQTIISLLEALVGLTSEGLSIAAESSPVSDKLEKARAPFLESLKALLNLYGQEVCENSALADSLALRIRATVNTTESALATLVSCTADVPCAWAKWLGLVLFDLGRLLRQGKATKLLAAELLERSAYWYERTGDNGQDFLIKAWQSSGLLYIQTRQQSRAHGCLLNIMAKRGSQKVAYSSDTLRLVGECVSDDPIGLVKGLCGILEDGSPSVYMSVFEKLSSCATRYESRLLAVVPEHFYLCETRLIETILQIRNLPCSFVIRLLLDQLRICAKLARWKELPDRAACAIDRLKNLSDSTSQWEHLLAEAYSWKAIGNLANRSEAKGQKFTPVFRDLDVALTLWRTTSPADLSEDSCFCAVEALSVLCGALAALENSIANVQFTNVYLKFVEQLPDTPVSDTLWLSLADHLRLLGLTRRSHEAAENVSHKNDDYMNLMGRILLDEDKAQKVNDELWLPESEAGDLTRAEVLLRCGDAAQSLERSTQLLKRLLRTSRRNSNDDNVDSFVNVGGIDVPILKGIHNGQRTTLLRLCHTLKQVGLAHERLEAVEDAEYYLLRGSALASALNCPVSESILLSDASLVALRKGDLMTARERLREAEKRLSDVPTEQSHFLDHARSYVYLRKGDELLENGEPEGALSEYSSAKAQISAFESPNRIRKIVQNTSVELTPREKSFLGKKKVSGLFLDQDGDWSTIPMNLFAAKIQVRRCRAKLMQSEKDAQVESQELFSALSLKTQIPVRAEDRAGALFGFYESLVSKNEHHHESLIREAWSIELGSSHGALPISRRTTRSTRSTSKKNSIETAMSTYMDLLNQARDAILEEQGVSLRLERKISFAIGVNTGGRDPLQTASCLAMDYYGLPRPAADLEKSFADLSLRDKTCPGLRNVVSTLSNLPTDLTVVGLSLSTSQKKLFLWRLEAGAEQPVLALLDLPGKDDINSVATAASTIEHILAELKRTSVLSTDAAESLTQEEKKTWWHGRFTLDQELGFLLKSLEESWLADLRGLLLGTSSEELPGIGSETEDRLVRALANGCLGPKEIDCVMSRLRPNSKAVSNTVRKFLCRDRSMDKRGPVVLVLDKQLQFLPWESMPAMQGQVASRVPDISLLYSQPVATSGKDLYFLLNPSGDLIPTQKRFEPLFETRPQWSGIAGFVDPLSKPRTTEIKRGIEAASIFLFCGHNGAEQYLAPRDLVRLKKVPEVTMLMGCSSGRLLLRGSYNPCGTAMDYLRAGCPCVVANIWDVTDGDIDRFTEHLLNRWIGVGSGLDHHGKPTISLAHAVLEARAACKMRYLVGAATVVYGAPVVHINDF